MFIGPLQKSMNDLTIVLIWFSPNYLIINADTTLPPEGGFGTHCLLPHTSIVISKIASNWIFLRIEKKMHAGL